MAAMFDRFDTVSTTTVERIWSDLMRPNIFITRSSRSARSAAKALPPPPPTPTLSITISPTEMITTPPSRTSIAFRAYLGQIHPR